MNTKLLLAVAAISLSGAGHAGEFVCNVQDTVGNHLTYAFGANTTNANGAFGGTMVETGFKKNGQMVISERGLRPIWIYSGKQGGGLNLYSRADPGWMLSVDRAGGAMLSHNGRFAGGGACSGLAPALTAGSVGDQGL